MTTSGSATRATVGLIAVMLSAVAAFAEPFRNLSFDDIPPENLPPGGTEFGGHGHAAVLLPGWGVAERTVGYNVGFIGLGIASIFDNKSSIQPHFPKVGEFTFVMYP